jgi:hypothetical protein
MNGIEKQAVFYRGYLIDGRSLTPLTIAWTTIVALWLLVYLVTAVGVWAKLPLTQPALHATGFAGRNP